MVQPAVARCVVSLFDADLGADFTAIFDRAIDAADIAADEQQITNPDVADVVGRRSRWVGQLDTQGFKLVFDFHATPPLFDQCGLAQYHTHQRSGSKTTYPTLPG